MESLLADAAQRAGRYRSELPHRPVAPTPAALAGLNRFDEPLPDEPSDPWATLALLDEAGSPATVASSGGRYYGFVTGGSLPVALAANWLAGAWDQNTALPVMSPVAARLHDVVTGWLIDILGLPSGTAVGFVTGSAMANTSALAAARDQQLARVGWDVQADGLFGAPGLTVVIGEHAHSTLVGALGVVGLGRRRVVTVPADDQGRMRADRLPGGVTGPAVICAQAGEVNTGAFDPFGPIIEWARDREAWVHVDGAFGLWALADPDRADLTAHLAEADSWAVDGHKWLNVPYDCGLCLVRRPEDLRRTFASAADYLPPDTGFEAMHHTPQASQRARQIEVWAALRCLGRRGVADLVARSCDHAVAMATQLRRGGLEVVNDVVLNQVLVRATQRPVDHGPGRRGPGRRDLLVRADCVEGPTCHADQHLGLGDDGGGRRGQRSRHHRRVRGAHRLAVVNLSRPLLRTARTAGAAMVVVAALLTASCSSGTKAPSSGSATTSTVWLCQPGRAGDPCADRFTATAIASGGSRSPATIPGLPDPSTASQFDCFYVYPTVSDDPAGNTSLSVQKVEIDAAAAQGSPFSPVCNVWAPMYRSQTSSTVERGLAGNTSLMSSTFAVAYDSLLSAWNDFVAHDDQGKPIILIGDSQGSAILIHLISTVIEHAPAVLARLVVAIIVGGNLQVPSGRTVGATFRAVPLCTSARQTGCAIAFSAYPSEPPIDSLFGRPSQGVSLQSGQSATQGQQVASQPRPLSVGPRPPWTPSSRRSPRPR